MSRVSSRLSFVGHRSLVVIQTFLLIATLFAPIPVAADDPTGDPGASTPPTTEPVATTEPTPDPTAEPTPEPTAEPTTEPPDAMPDPTPEPTAEPTTEPPDAMPDPTPEPTAEPPAATPEATPEAPVATPDPIPAPTTEPSTSVGTPAIQSDLADYPPGGLVTLTGSGWQPGESVHIFVNDDWGSSWSRNVDVTADASGAIVDQFNLPNWFVAIYRVVATGSLSGSATTTFTDGNLRFSYSPSGVGNFAGSWTKHTNSSCSGSAAGTSPTSGTGTVTNNPGGTLAAGAGAGEWIKITVQATVGSYSFVNWSGPGSFSSTNATLCAPGFAGNGNDGYVANYTLVTTQSTALSVSPAAGNFGGTVNLSATLTAGASGLSGKTVTFSLNGTSVGPATTNSSGVATINSASLAGINAGTYASGISASFAGDSGFAASTGSATLTVNKAAGSVTINNIPSSATFGGSFTPAFTKAGDGTASAASLTTATCTISSGVVSYVGAGTCTLQASVTAGTNHLAETGSAQSFTIGKAAGSVTINNIPSSATFGGSFTPAFTKAGDGMASAASLTTATCTISSGVVSYVGAGTCTLQASVTAGTNHLAETGSAQSFTIDRADAECTVTGYDVVYDAADHTATGSCLGVEGETLTGLDLAGTTHTNAGSYTDSWSFTDGTGNYNDTAGSVADQIDRADAECTVTGYDVVYDAADHTATGSCLGVEGETLTGLDLAGTTHTNAGSYTDSWSFTDGTGNYNDTAGSVADQIDRADAECTVTGYDVVYDAADHTATGSCLGVEGETLTGLDLAGTTHTNAGSYTDSWSFTDGTGNYNDTAGSVADQIDRADAECTVTGYDVVYDAADHTATGSCLGVEGETLTGLDLAGTTHTNAGSYTDSWSFTDGTGNYNDTAGSVADQIDRADAECTVTGYDVVYDAADHTATGSCLGVEGETLTGLDLAGTTHTNAGSYTDSWSFTDGTGNYNDTAGSVADQIDRADAECTVTGYDVVYDAADHTATGSCLGVEGETLTGLDLAGTTHTNAGSYTDSWSFTDGTGNYNDTAGSVADQIDRADAECTVTGYDVVYDAADHTATGSCLGVEGETLTGLDLAGTTHTNAGSYTDSWSFTDGTGNYNDTAGSVADQIDRADSITILTFEAGPYVYRGTAFAATARVTGIGGLDESVAVAYGGDCTNVTVAGGCAATATFAGDSNHYGSGDTKSITILRKNVTGAFTAADKVWDNNTTATVVTTTVVGALVGDDVELMGGTAAFATSTVGTWTVTLTGAGLAGSDAGNYYLTSVGTTTATITTAFRILGFDSPVDMTVVGNPRIYNSVKNGQTVPLKFRVFNLSGTEVTSTTGLNAWARNVACASGVVEPDLIPITSTADTGLRRTGDRFHFNWAVPKGALKCYQVLIQTVDGSTTMVGSLNGTPVQEAWFKSK